MNQLETQNLLDFAKKSNVSLSKEHLEQFSTLLATLAHWNRKTNLTSIPEKDFFTLHLLDSLSILSSIPSSTKILLDVGSGGGFPGLPIAIARPDLQVSLLEARQKKCDFLRAAYHKLGLTNVAVLEGQAEVFARQDKHKEKYDFVTARALAGFGELLEILSPFCKTGGIILAMKATGAERELEQAGINHEKLGIKFLEIKKILLAETQIDRELMIFEKIKIDF